MTHKKGTSFALIALLSVGFLTNSVTSQAADQDTNLNISKSLVENTIKPTLLSKKFAQEKLAQEKSDKLADIKFEEKRLQKEANDTSISN